MTIRHLKRAAARVITTAALQDRRVRGGVAGRQASTRWRLGAVAGIGTLAVAAMGTIGSPAQGIGECANNTPANPPPNYVVVDLTNGGNPNGTGNDEFIWGTSLRDVITGGGGDDIICGNGGDDELHGDAGEDEIYGGEDPTRSTAVRTTTTCSAEAPKATSSWVTRSAGPPCRTETTHCRAVRARTICSATTGTTP